MKDTYLAVIRNSLGSGMFKQLFMRLNGKKTDIMRNGDLSCAYYTSAILALFGLIKEVHATVDSTIADMKRNGWVEIQQPKVGCVLVWQETHFEKSGEMHKHIGFYVGKGRAISNSDKKRVIADHPYRIYNGRGLAQMLWHPNLDK